MKDTILTPIGVDPGWWRTKWALGSTHQSFLSLAAPTPDGYGNSTLELGNAQPYEMLQPWPMLIGTAAYAQGLGAPDLTAEWIKGKSYLALLLTALAGNCQDQNLNYRIVTGLPPSYMHLKDWLEANVQGTYRVQFRGSNVQHIQVKTHVVAQGVGALLCDAIDPTGYISDEALTQLLDPLDSDTTAICDIGAGTACLVLARGLIPVKDDTRSVKHGAWEIEEHLRNALSGAYGPASVEELSRHELLRRARQSRLRVSGVPVPPQFLNQAIEWVAAKVVKEMRSLWGDANHIDRILIVGGGGALMADEIRRSYPRARLVNEVDPVYANVEGYRRLSILLGTLG